MSNRTKIIIVSIIAAIVVTIIIIASLWQPSGTLRVNIKTVPDDSKIKLDGKTINAGRQDLPYGEHTFEISHAFLDTVTQKINTDNLTNGQELILMPDANSERALKWLNEHPEVQAKREVAGSVAANQEQSNYLEKHPIIAQLPHEAIDFRIDYVATENGDFRLNITLFPYSNPQDRPEEYREQLIDYKAEAIAYLKEHNVDASKASITWLPEDPDKK